MSAPDIAKQEMAGHRPPPQFIRAISFVYRFVVLLIITAYREANRDA